MRERFLKSVLILLFVFSVNALAQDEDLQSVVNYKVNKMKTELKLTDDQAIVIKPILKAYLTKRRAVLEEVAGEGIVDHVSVKTTLKSIKEDEYRKLSKVLSDEQMKKLINKENLMATLNPDSMESTVDDGVGLTAEGANFKF